MKIPFDIKYRPQIESGEYKVETRDGRPVKIIYWEAKGPAPIIGLFMTDDGSETTVEVHPNGRWSDDESYELDFDLFIVTPEPELTKFEKELESFYNHHLQVCTYDNQGTVEDSLHDGAAKLLTLARKELESEIKVEVPKNLPRWEKTVFCGTYVDNFFIDKSKFLFHDGYYINIKDLETLPGFKED